MKTKKCKSCKEEKHIDEFNNSKTNKDKKEHVCKKCRSKRNSYNQMKRKETKLSKITPIENLEGEEWRDVQEYEGLYQVSNLGRVKSLDRLVTKNDGIQLILKGKILKPNIDKGNYLSVMLSKNGVTKRMKIHRLVAIAFIPNPNNYPEVNHKKEFNKDKNNVNNLEWCTSKYNANYGTRNERSAKTKGLAKIVYQHSLEGVFIKKWDSTNQCSKYGFFSSNVSSCCRGKIKRYKGYIWSYTKLE